MNITLVVDRLNWGGHYNMEAIARVCGDVHKFTITDLLEITPEKVKDADLVMACNDTVEGAIYKLWEKYGFVFASRIAGWSGIYRAVRSPQLIKDVIVGVACCNQELVIPTRKVYDTYLVKSIPAGVDTDAFKPADKLGRGWVWTGRLKDHRKDVDTLRVIQKKIRGIRIKTQRRRFTRVIPINWPDSMVEWYQSSRGYFRTSRSEGSSNSLLEAMACGLPVLATHTGVAFRILDPMWLMITPSHFIKNIKLLNENDGLTLTVGLQNREKVLDGWRIQDRREDWLSFFEECMKK